MSQKTLQEDLNYVQQAPLEITYFNGNMDIIQQLDDEPNDVGGLTSAQLKAEFDKAGNTIKTYLNETLIPELLAADAIEQSRAQAETGRVNAENFRQVCETERINMDAQRHRQEQARVAAEESRTQAEQSRVREEEARKQQELLRTQAETQRAQAEQARVEGETERLTQLNTAVQQSNEASKRAVQAANDAQNMIDDTALSATRTWSSQKIRSSATRLIDLRQAFGLVDTDALVISALPQAVTQEGSADMYALAEELCQSNAYSTCKVQISDKKGVITGAYPIAYGKFVTVSGSPDVANGEDLEGYRLSSVFGTPQHTNRYGDLYVLKSKPSGLYCVMLHISNGQTDETLNLHGWPADSAATGQAIQEAKKSMQNLMGGVYTFVEELVLPRNLTLTSLFQYKTYKHQAMLVKLELPAAAHAELGWIYAEVINAANISDCMQIPLMYVGSSTETAATYCFGEIWQDKGWWRSVSSGQPVADNSQQVPLMANGCRDVCQYDCGVYTHICSLKSDHAFPKGTKIRVFAVEDA